MTKVLFVCLHNAARSRMAEALLLRLGGSRFEVTSAGFEPQPANPLVVEALAEIGLTLRSTEPQPSIFDLYRAGRLFHHVISVCDYEHGERCPIFPGVPRQLRWSFPDPSTFAGSRADRLASTIAVRDAIQAHIAAWLRTLPVNDPTALQRT